MESLHLFDADTCISVTQSQSNIYKAGVGCIEPILQNKSIREERNFIYEEKGGIHSFRYDSFKKNSSIYGERNTYVIIDDIESVRNDSVLLKFIQNKSSPS